MSEGVGVVLGKFLPPHRGHLYLCEFARARCERLHVVVGTLEREPIPGALRFSWMQDALPGAHVHHLTDENPQEPHEHPEFWRIWRESLLRVLPESVDYVFASEPYGERLAQELGARFVPVDLDRIAVPISGTQVREDPMKHWAYLPRVVRPYFVRRVAILGPESSGKTTLARRLAEALDTLWVPEYARGYLERQGGRVAVEDMVPIALGQRASEEALAFEAERALICDTDTLTTQLWSELLFGEASAELRELAREPAPYAQTLVLAPDIPFEPDLVRYRPAERVDFFERICAELDTLGRPYEVLRGEGDERYGRALELARAVVR